ISREPCSFALKETFAFAKLHRSWFPLSTALLRQHIVPEIHKLAAQQVVEGNNPAPIAQTYCYCFSAGFIQIFAAGGDIKIAVPGMRIDPGAQVAARLQEIT